VTLRAENVGARHSAAHPRILLSLIALLGCLLQPVAPALAYPSPDPSPTGRGEWSANPSPLPVGEGSGEGSALASQVSTIPGIHVYAQSNVNCASPQYAETAPSYTASSTAQYHMVAKALYVCSSGTTVRVRVFAEAVGWGCNIAATRIRCLSGQCEGFTDVYPATVVDFGYHCVFCNGLHSAYEADLYLPPGQYELYAEAGSNANCI